MDSERKPELKREEEVLTMEKRRDNERERS